MIVLHLMGHAHLSSQDQPTDLSLKSLALLAYLALEKQPQHREHVAGMLWDNMEARQNLRVELSRIRASGLGLFPNSVQMLSLEGVQTDLELWENQAQMGFEDADLPHWLSQLRGLPLAGMEDVGGASFQDWVYQQATLLTDRIEAVLRRVHGSFLKRKMNQAAEMLKTKAERLGIDIQGEHAPILPPASSSFTGLHFSRPNEEGQLRSALERSVAGPLLVNIRGGSGSGKSHLARWLSQYSGWLTLEISSVRSSRLALASLASSLQDHVSSHLQEVLRTVLFNPGPLEEDLIRVATVMAQLGRPMLLIVENAQVAPVEFATLLEFLLRHVSRILVVVLSRDESHGLSELSRSLGRRLEAHQRLEIQLRPLSLESVEAGLMHHDPGLSREMRLAYANQLLQRSDGNIKHLIALLEQDMVFLREAALPSEILEGYLGEVGGWPEELQRAMRYLSVVHAVFDEPLAQKLLECMGIRAPRGCLNDALERGILLEAQVGRTLAFPYWTPISDTPQPHTRFEFRLESLRITLASTLPQPVRQEIRRHLAHLLTEQDPGLACYYARRAGLDTEAEQLFRRYQNTLPEGSPLRAGIPYPRILDYTPPACEPSSSSQNLAVLREQGYQVALERGWLTVRRRGRYGHADTLNLLFSLPSANEPGLLRGGALKVVWRLDEFKGGYDMLPCKVPFPLRLRIYGANRAEILTPEQIANYCEDDIEHVVHGGVRPDGWMEHRITPQLLPGQNTSTLELSVRALDVALVIGSLEWCGKSLLDFNPTVSRPGMFK
jgi:hypothetical protein